MFEHFKDQAEFRVWVAACATGQEAYSIAMMLHDVCEQENISPNIKIFATDMHKSSVEFAAQGIYSAVDLQGVKKQGIFYMYLAMPGNSLA